MVGYGQTVFANAPLAYPLTTRLLDKPSAIDPLSPIRIPPFSMSPKKAAVILDVPKDIGYSQANTARSLRMTRSEVALQWRRRAKPTAETKHANLYQTDCGVGWHAGHRVKISKQPGENV
jgi:hypothetical protein